PACRARRERSNRAPRRSSRGLSHRELSGPRWGLPPTRACHLAPSRGRLHTGRTVRLLMCALLVALTVLGGTAEARPKSRTRAKAAAAKVAKPATAKRVDVATAKQLGAAYRAYDDNELAAAKKHLAKIDDKKVVALDYV